MDNAWKTRSKKTLLEREPFLKVEEHIIELPDGRVIPDWSVVIVPDSATILARTREGQFLFFRQHKYAIQGITLAPPAGMLTPGEDPLEAAKRELREETGYEAARWTLLGSFRGEPNRGVNTLHLFLAEDAHLVCPPAADDLETQELIFLSREDLEAALLRGELKAVMWSCAAALGLLYLGERDRKSGKPPDNSREGLK